MIENIQNVDFKRKIENHFDDENKKSTLKTNAINEFLVFFVNSFKTRNSFFVKNFNFNNLHLVKSFYNKLKTNVLQQKQYSDYQEFFSTMNNDELKCVNFIVDNYINNVCQDENNKKIYIEMSKFLKNNIKK